MKVYKYRTFRQWAKSERIDENQLRCAIDEIELGLFEAKLGGGLYKKRIARKGQGKRDGYRTIIALKTNERAFFMYGFAKNERDNIDIRELIVYRKLARHYFDLTDTQLNQLIENGELFEVTR